MEMKQVDQDVIESLIDLYTLPKVLDVIADLCGQKALHLEENWQDKSSARVWTNMASAVEHVAHKVSANF